MKKISNIVLVLSMIALGISSCRQEQASLKAVPLSEAGIEATSPYLTKDNKGNAVICWAEKSANDSLYQLKYAVYSHAEDKFGAPVSIPVSAGLNISPENMGKIAFKSDNTVIAVFARPFKNEKNPFAGAIYYTSSADGGKNWSAPQFLHSDTTHSYGRSFFDITRLKNGEAAAIWLDGRFGKEIKGSGLFYAATATGRGFGQDTCLYKGTCECCRTDILQDDDGNIHIAYRSILFPSSLMGKQARDMVYSFSNDNGVTFSPARVISKDNWAIEGCPHTGPSLAVSNSDVNVVWFTAGGDPGIYYSSAQKMEAGFQNRRLLTRAGRHPQMVPINKEKFAMVCEESLEHPAGHSKAAGHTMNGMTMGHVAAGSAKIVLRSLDNKGSQHNTVDITNGQHADHHAVITNISNNVMVAWVREEGGHSSVYYAIVGI